MYKVGDWVKTVAERPADAETSPQWSESMDRWAGKEGMVTEIGRYVHVAFNTGWSQFSYKASWLTLVRKRVDPPFKSGDYVRVLKKFPEVAFAHPQWNIGNTLLAGKRGRFEETDWWNNTHLISFGEMGVAYMALDWLEPFKPMMLHAVVVNKMVPEVWLDEAKAVARAAELGGYSRKFEEVVSCL